jgi:hypothetical protein
MLSLLANAFRVATRTEDQTDPPAQNWHAPPHWHLPVRDLPGRDRY